MDARTTDSPVISERDTWLQRERASGRFYDRLGWIIAAFLAGMMAFSIWVLRRGAEPGTLLSPPLIALLLIANLLPAIALMVLYSRRVAVRRAEEGGLGSGRLHVRLVALFSSLAAVPTVLVTIFASLLFQSNLDFWFSKRTGSMLENTVQIAQTTYRYELGRVADEATAMAGNMAEGLSRVPIDDPRVSQALAAQTYLRSLNEAAILKINAQGEVQTLAIATGSYGSTIDPRRIKTAASKPAATKTTTKTVAKKAPVKKTAVKKTSAAPGKLAVKADEKPWTKKELDEVRGELMADRERLRSELNMAEHELHDLMRDAGDGAGNDQADVGSTTFERDHEMSLANNAREMLAQTERALLRIDAGTYGVCESCGEPIGKMRLMAFPRATLCLSCKQREERR